ncbi:hypothetical protein [Asticcacaulis excentricus]|uniref:hypothetical protein n=1 Tax=Asticcacaulis excentricus TaxID=78587 RepID=UPI000F83A881|nr:hypothetical protein [Asticcacaulis excentricus]
MTVSYPRIYRYRGSTRLAIIGLGLIFLGMAAGGFYLGLIEWREPDGDWFTRFAWPAISTFFLISGVIWLVETLRASLALYPDRLVCQTAWSRYEVRRDDISGIKIASGSAKHIHLPIVLKDGRTCTVEIFGARDDVLDGWFAGIENLDRNEAKEVAERLFENSAYGPARDIRERRARRDQTCVQWAYCLTSGLTLWGMLWPRPLPWCMGALAGVCLLIVVLAILNRRRWALHDIAQDNRVHVGGLAIAPSVILALRACAEGDFVDWTAFLVTAGLAGMVAFLVIRRLEHPSFKAVDLFAWPLYAAWFAGVLSFGNWYFDDARPKIIPVEVVARGEGSDYTLTIGAWGPKTGTEDVDVPKALYDKTPVGGRLCVHLHPGRLGWEWYEVCPCQAESKPST